MKELVADLWTCGGIPAITTNGYVKHDGTAVMGAGCALEAVTRYPDLKRAMGRRLTKFGNHLFYFDQYNLITFPTKDVWWRESSLEIIARSALELDKWITDSPENKLNIYLPRPGCGNGRLTWPMVKPVLEPILSDRVVIVSKPGRNLSPHIGKGWEREHGL